MQTLRGKKNGLPQFKLPLSPQDFYQYLVAAYAAEVENRDCKFSPAEPTLQRIWETAQFLTSDSPKFGLMMLGRPGNGKTTLMKAINRACWHLMRIGKIDPHSYGFQYTLDFGIPTYGAKELVEMAYSEDAEYKAIIDKPLIGIDDFGDEPMETQSYGKVLTPMRDIIEYRYSKQMFTMFSSNLDPKEISSKYGIRVADRLREMAQTIIFGDQESFRK
ncbi:MAG: hypothetical protein LIP09_04860 [Bacteroidales bacterium]|nr:hypothetical protein [Bacteroidales bacterium]